MAHINRDEAIRRIRAALKRRSQKAWSVSGNRGTAYGWIDVQAPPKRRVDEHYTSAEDCAELARLFGLRQPVHNQGLSINPDSREWYVRQVEAENADGERVAATGQASAAP